MKIKEKLKKELANILSEDQVKLLPSRYPIIGSAVIVRLDPKLLRFGEIIGKKILEILPQAKSVWAIITTRRIIREPKTIHLAGERNPVVIHKELNTIFELDISKLTFSPGNKFERKKLIELIDSKDVVFDMFACVGNLSLPLAVNNKTKIFVMEINPLAYRFLLRNIILNHVQNRAVPIYGNNMLFTKKKFADHVLLGYIPTPNSRQIFVGINSLKKYGTLHLHKLVPKGAEKEELLSMERNIENDFGVSIEDISFDIVKSFSPKFNHVVYRISINKSG